LVYKLIVTLVLRFFSFSIPHTRFFAAKLYEIFYFFMPSIFCVMSSFLAMIGSCFFFLDQLWFADNHVLFFRSSFLWIDSYYSFFQKFSFLIDSLSATMLVVITVISFIVHIYSYKYMFFDIKRVYFLSLLNLFTFFMILLVISGNVAQLLVGWEGVGLTSYLLIGFWSSRLEANKAALKAILMNKIGDVALLIFVTLSFYYFQTTSYFIIFSLIDVLVTDSDFTFALGCLGPFKLIDALCFLLVISAFVKSAQFGFHTWLPDAMEGPTPVSALLHAATMVTAGVYLLVRFSFLLEAAAPVIKSIILVVGSLTALFGSVMALVQFDVKRIIAYSTTSQLGFMFIACGLSGYTLAMYHLFTHAFFKSLLFLVAGVLIHNLNNEQDIRKMGSLRLFSPVLYIYMLVGFMSLGGFPFLSGYYSKDLILSLAYSSGTSLGFYSFLVCLISSFFTSLYSLRAIYYIFFTRPRFSYNILTFPDRLDIGMYYYLSLFPLFLGSLVIGFYTFDLFASYSNSFFFGSVFISYTAYFAEFFFPWYLRLLVFSLFTISALLFFLILQYSSYFHGYIRDFDSVYSEMYFFISKRFFFDILYNKLVIHNFLKLSEHINTHVFRGFLEFFGPVLLLRLSKIFNDKFLLRLHSFSYNLRCVIILLVLILILIIVFYS